MTRRVAIAAVALAALLATAACGDDDDDDASTTTTTADGTTTTADGATPTTDAGPSLDDVAVELTEIGRFDQPIDLAVDTRGELVIAEKGGRVRRVDDGSVVLDLSGDVSTGDEQGLLGIAFAPDGSRFYAHYTNRAGDTRVHEWSGDLDPASRRPVLEVDQPYANHNGGRVTFGPDGLLYLGLGDGGRSGDPHGNGQNEDALLGKILRWDPVGDGTPERWAIGLRNPWRFSFDRLTGDLWVGDVGQNEWEEIDLIPAGTAAGVNLGWNRYEGTHEFEDAGSRDGLLFPIHEYDHDDGQSVVGGFVYRGSIEEWQGVYFFTDTYDANLRALLVVDDEVQHRDLDVDVPGGYVSSFGEDADGELYVLSLDGGVYRLDRA